MEPEVPVLKVTKLEKSFRVGNQLISVIKGMDFEIFKGDFAIIIGPSGSGKSTLLHMLLGLEVPTSGSVMCLGNDLYSLPNEDARASFRKKHVGMVYQQPNWIKSLNVVENVAFPLSLLGVDKGEAIKQAWHVILKMNMSNWVNYYPTELSGGQQQKIALARALVTDPEIIIADEPTGNLDFDSGQILMNLLKELNDSGKTVLMVTHDLEYVRFAKSVIKIFDGKVASFVDRSVYGVAVSEEKVNDSNQEVSNKQFDNQVIKGKRNPAGLDIFSNDKTKNTSPKSTGTFPGVISESAKSDTSVTNTSSYPKADDPLVFVNTSIKLGNKSNSTTKSAKARAVTKKAPTSTPKSTGSAKVAKTTKRATKPKKFEKKKK